MKQKTKVLLVGQGLAGTLLAFELLESGIDFKIIASENKPKASMVAAGMVNPLVFKRLTKSWMLDELLPVMRTRYKSLEKKLGEPLYFPKSIVKPLSEQEKQLWKEKMQLPDFKNFIRCIDDKPPLNGIVDAAGYAWVEQGGYLKIQQFLTLSKNYFIGLKRYHEFGVDTSKIRMNAERIQVGEFETEKLVFCEGAHLTKNHFFDFVKLQPVKGEVLQIKAEKLSEDFILNKKVFVLPIGGQRFKIGSTYNWHELDDQPTQSGKESIIERFENLVHTSYQIENHWAGVRPTVIDRRPVLGIHPQYIKIAVFNGLGTKGVMLAPFWAKEMVNLLTSQNYSLPPEVDVCRFVK